MARITDGFSTIISFADFATVKFYEAEVTPPGMDAGGPNDTTTMRNTTYRTRQPKKLKSLSSMTLVAQYDSAVFATSGSGSVWAMIGKNQLITVTWPDGATFAFWGWLDKFIPNQIKEGEPPTATVTIEPSNMNASFAETAPVFTASPPPPP
jgi:hypothetical protein